MLNIFYKQRATLVESGYYMNDRTSILVSNWSCPWAAKQGIV